jgi:hypothetical protein
MQVTLKGPKNALDTNCLWFGNKITPDEAKFVAFALTRAGVGLRSIRHFQDGSGAKERKIEIGADPDLVGRPVLTPLQIKQLSTF